MLPVSNSFKKAIKNDIREIYGYVDIKYEQKNFNTEVTQIPTRLNIVVDDGILNGEKNMTKYATLEENYTLLDGSFMLWNENVFVENGYISDNVFDDINDSTIIITNNSTTLTTKGISIYFKENLPINFNVVMTNDEDEVITDNVTNNQSYVYQYIFTSEQIIKTIELEITRIEFPNNRIRIAYIDFNLSDFCEGDELIDFEVNEEFDMLVENLPVNTCSVKLNNYPDANNGSKFDVINPKGIVRYLNDDVTIEPYIGVLTEENGIEYVPMGLFYLTDWSSDSDKNVTLNGKSLLNKLKNYQMIWNSNMFSPYVDTPILKTMIENSSGLQCSFPTYSMYLDNWTNMKTNLFDYFSYISPCLLYNNRPDIATDNDFRKIYVNRFNKLVINDIDNHVVDKINRNDLLEDVEYITKTPIKNVQINYTTYSTDANTTAANIIDTTYTLTNDETYLWFKVDKNIATINSLTRTILQGSANVTLIGFTMRMVHIKVTGTVGSIIKIVCNAQVPNSSTSHSFTTTLTNNNIEKGDTLNLNFGSSEIPNFDSVQNVFFELDTPYKVNAQTIGDPSLEIGDSISIQTRYTDQNEGYKQIIITKQSFTFDGGLKCELEGVGS